MLKSTDTYFYYIMGRDEISRTLYSRPSPSFGVTSTFLTSASVFFTSASGFAVWHKYQYLVSIHYKIEMYVHTFSACC